MTQEFPLQWPKGWPRAKSRATSQFKATIYKALDNVNEELRRFAKDSGHKISNVVISSNVSLTSQRPEDPGVAVYFSWDGMTTCIAVDRYSKVEDNLQAIYHCLEAERTKLRHGGIELVRAAFRGYAALPPPSASARKWYDVLGLTENHALEECERSFKARARKAHPDNGGSADEMAALNAAIEQARLFHGKGRK